MLEAVRERADYVINTSGMTLGMLQSEIYRIFVGESSNRPLAVNVMSFGFKYGIPIEADLVFDVRFLPNPFYVSELRSLSGMDSEVADFIFKHGDTKEFMRHLQDMVSFLLPMYIEEGKHGLTIAIGCTGGRHRSVAMAKALTEFIQAQGYSAQNINRDLEKG
jgi:UPF0042 nucleotide-binding protein